ncbi:MAG TPA: hypothetical protein VFQ43_14530 [Nitrososphaera sp.]|nr:hypothetical protein [Nitrososphaera sp.]
MKIKITQICSSNHRPVDHPDFKGDVQNTDIVDDDKETWEFIQLYVWQGDRVVLERVKGT